MAAPKAHDWTIILTLLRLEHDSLSPEMDVDLRKRVAAEIVLVQAELTTAQKGPDPIAKSLDATIAPS